MTWNIRERERESEREGREGEGGRGDVDKNSARKKIANPVEEISDSLVWHLATLKQEPVFCISHSSAHGHHVLRKWRGRSLFPVEFLCFCFSVSSTCVASPVQWVRGGEGALRAAIKNEQNVMYAPSWRTLSFVGRRLSLTKMAVEWKLQLTENTHSSPYWPPTGKIL